MVHKTNDLSYFHVTNLSLEFVFLIQHSNHVMFASMLSIVIFMTVEMNKRQKETAATKLRKEDMPHAAEAAHVPENSS